MAAGTTFFRKTVVRRNYRFSAEASPVIKLSIKSKKNNNVNVSSIETSFWNEDGEKVFGELYQLSDKGRTIVLSVTCPPLEKANEILEFSAFAQKKFDHCKLGDITCLAVAPFWHISHKFVDFHRFILISVR